MTLKSFQIKMEPQAHKRLKTRASQLGLPIGPMIQNLLSAFECRLEELLQDIETSCSSDTVDIERQMMELLFKHDGGLIDDKAFRKEIKKITASLKEDEFKPGIKLKEDAPIAKKK